jgi:hypothetical protein
MRVARIHSILWCVLGALPVAVQADIIGSVIAVPAANTSYNLTTLGTVDWAFYDTTANPANGLPTNDKLGGTSIGTAIALGGGSLRGSSASAAEPDFTFTDGTSPASGTGDNPGGLFNTQLDTLNAGLQLTIDLPTTDQYTIYLWTAAFFARGAFTASLAGFSDYTSLATDDALGTSPKQSFLYTLTAQANTAGDDLTISLVTETDRGSNAHVLLVGAAVGLIPEPTTMTLLFAGLGLLVFLRDRHGSLRQQQGL